MGLLDRLRRRPTPPPPQPRAPAPDPSGYTVQVLLPRRVRLDPAAIHANLRRWREDVDRIGDDPDLFGITVPTGFPLPIVVHVFRAAADAYADRVQDALTWSRSWRARHEAVAAATDAIVLSMPIDPAQPYAIQLLSLLAVLDTVLVSLEEDLADAAVIHWMPAQQVMPFERYRMLRKELGPSGPAVGVRIANVGGRPGEKLADTLGLAPLGLPDLQVIFADGEVEPAEIAVRLLVLAQQVFLGQDLDVPHEPAGALAPPARDAITIRLG